jgi:hypothetical protein
LRFGVIDAVGLLLAGLLTSRQARTAPNDTQLAAGFDESLTLVYRVLFLMFAEARGLVPNWHPIYRDHYTIESLRDLAERPGARGLWEALQAISGWLQRLPGGHVDRTCVQRTALLAVAFADGRRLRNKR